MPTRNRRPTARRQRRLAALTVAWLLLAAHPAAAQGGPIQLFPNLGSETREQPQAPAGQAPAPTTLRSEGREQAPRGFRVEGLAAPGIDAIGLAGPAEGGFDQDMWAGSDGELVLALLNRLPVATENPPLRALARRLLMTGAPVEGVVEPGSVLGARVERLLAMGDLDDASALLDRVPASDNDSQIARLVAQVALLRGDDDTACRRAADIAPASDAAFWAKVTIYCRLADGDEEGARLALDLLRDQGQTDDTAFFSLVESIAAGQPQVAPLPAEGPSALHVALYRRAGLPLPAAALASASPELLAVAAREPSLVAVDRLALDERAFRLGALSADGLAAAYDDLGPDEGADALRRIASDWSPQTRALAYNLLPDQPAAERGQILDALWRSAHGSERFLIGQVFAARFAELPAERGRLRLAPSFARALLAGERPIPAARWYSLVATETGDAQAREDLVGLTPLFALAGFGGSVTVPDFDDEALSAWLAATPDAHARAPRLLALMEGVGVPVPASAWQQLIAWPDQVATPAPPAALWRALDRASSEQRLGETVLLALSMMGGRPEAAHPEALTAALRGLRAVGLEQEARAIAMATALQMDL